MFKDIVTLISYLKSGII